MPDKVHPSLVPMFPSEAVLKQMTTRDVIFEEDFIGSDNENKSDNGIEVD
jgi:hypothetical protein